MVEDKATFLETEHWVAPSVGIMAYERKKAGVI